jgi:4-amino-4-deoxy-L-arabinose transferase-like glycosyltransferase
VRLTSDPRARAAAPFALAAALFLATRLSLLWRFPPFLDESLYATWAARVHDSVNDRFVALAYGKLPLLSWLGAGLVYADIAPLDAVRLVSFAAGLVSMAASTLLANRLGGRTAAIATAFLYVLLPLVFVHDVIGIMEPLVTALLVLALYLEVRLAERPTWGLALTLGLVLGAALLTKETGQIALVLLPASLLVFDWHRAQLARRFARWFGCAVTAAALAGVAYLVLTLSDYWDDYPRARESLGTFRDLGDGLSHPLRWLRAEWTDYRVELFGYATIPIVVACLFGIALALLRRRRLALLYLLWLLVPLVVAVLFLPNPFSRYLVPLAPMIAVFAGYGIAAAAELLGTAIRRPELAAAAAAAVVAVAAVTAVWFDGQVLANPGTAPYPGLSREEYETGWAAGTGWRELAKELRRRADSSQIVVSSYAGLSDALALSLDGDHRIQIVSGQPGNSGPEASSDYVVENGTPLPSDAGYGVLVPAWTYQRPENGTPLVLYQRGVRWNGHFYATPEELRQGLALPDADFDRFVAAHPEIGAWYRATAG